MEVDYNLTIKDLKTLILQETKNNKILLESTEIKDFSLKMADKDGIEDTFSLFLNDIYAVGKVGSNNFLLKLNENFKPNTNNNDSYYFEEKVNWIEPDAYKPYIDDYRLKIYFPNQSQGNI
jgi:hypothetical protein